MDPTNVVSKGVKTKDQGVASIIQSPVISDCQLVKIHPIEDAMEGSRSL